VDASPSALSPSALSQVAVQRQAVGPLPAGGDSALLPEQRVIATAPAEPERWLNFAMIAFGIAVAVLAGLYTIGFLLESSLKSGTGGGGTLRKSEGQILHAPCDRFGDDRAMRFETGDRSTA